MAGRKGVAQREGGRYLDDPQARERYLEYLRQGHGRNSAAEVMGIAYTTVWRYFKVNTEFLEEVREAERTSVESNHKFWREVRDDESQPMSIRLNASEKLERALGRDEKNDHKIIEHKHTHELVGGDQMAEIVELQRRVEERKAIDVRSTEQ